MFHVKQTIEDPSVGLATFHVEHRGGGRILDPETPEGQDGDCVIAVPGRALRLRCVPPNPSWDAWNLTTMAAQPRGESTA